MFYIPLFLSSYYYKNCSIQQLFQHPEFPAVI